MINDKLNFDEKKHPIFSQVKHVQFEFLFNWNEGIVGLIDEVVNQMPSIE